VGAKEFGLRGELEMEMLLSLHVTCATTVREPGWGGLDYRLFIKNIRVFLKC
jgi:hypothetical protein